MTVSGGGDDEIPEFFEPDWSLVDYPRFPLIFAGLLPAGRTRR